ncbi:MAG: DUF3570 domain-containing protein [Planctomycetota bacterium]|jgi:hypothetical protein|nr:DUF3570 domain-containing protein [Planctomycetota bacterium]
MQLNDTAQLRRSLAAATAMLLGGGQAAALESAAPWDAEARVQYYSEKDRVQIVEGVVGVTHQAAGGQSYGASVVLDAMTGSSPNGAIATDSPQTFTRPSGSGSYETAAGQTPLDDTFHDTRVGLDLSYGHGIGDNLHLNYALQGSVEYDYRSFGASVGVDRDFNQRNTTLSFGLSLNFDTSEPVGGIPDPYGFMPAYPNEKDTIGVSDTKLVTDVQVGVTQLLSPRSLIRSNFVFGLDDGYINDPYKIVSVVDPVTGELVSDADRRYRYENRPDSKARFAWYNAWQQMLRDNDVLRVSYRLYGDDWGTISNTIDGFYRWQMTDTVFFEPHLRWYQQTAADFYRTSLVATDNPEHVSADYRLADMMTYTVGLTAGWDLNPTSELRLGLEYYLQQADPSDVIGVQAQQTLIEDTEAIMVRLGYGLQW